MDELYKNLIKTRSISLWETLNYFLKLESVFTDIHMKLLWLKKLVISHISPYKICYEVIHKTFMRKRKYILQWEGGELADMEKSLEAPKLICSASSQLFQPV